MFRHALAAVIEFSISQYNPINSSPTISGTGAVSIPPAAFRLRNKRVKSASSPYRIRPHRSAPESSGERMNFPGFILSPAGFAMPGGGSPFCPDLRIVPLRHRKRPAPRPPAVSAEKQAQYRPRPHFPHPLRAVPPPAPSEPRRGTSRSSYDGLRSRRNPSVPLVFRSRAGRNVPPGIDARGHRLPASHAARRLPPAFRTCRPKPVRAS